MSYTVRWKRSARDRLAEIWVGAADRQAVTDAANAIENDLERNPLNCGESRATPEDRIVIALPLAVAFRVDVARQTVAVLSVRALPSGA